MLLGAGLSPTPRSWWEEDILLALLTVFPHRYVTGHRAEFACLPIAGLQMVTPAVEKISVGGGAILVPTLSPSPCPSYATACYHTLMTHFTHAKHVLCV